MKCIYSTFFLRLKQSTLKFDEWLQTRYISGDETRPEFTTSTDLWNLFSYDELTIKCCQGVTDNTQMCRLTRASEGILPSEYRTKCLLHQAGMQQWTEYVSPTDISTIRSLLILLPRTSLWDEKMLPCHKRYAM